MMGKVSHYIKWLWGFCAPPPQWHLPFLALAGIFVGIALHVVHISNAIYYLSSDPKVCINCHVMTTPYATWERGDHGVRARCVDCHLPQDNIFRKLFYKATDGMWHATIFTLRAEPQVIRIHERGKGAVQENCQRCHARVVSNLNWDPERRCATCHRSSPHGTVNSLAATPYARVPRLEKPIPTWLEKLIRNETSGKVTANKVINEIK